LLVVGWRWILGAVLVIAGLITLLTIASEQRTTTDRLAVPSTPDTAPGAPLLPAHALTDADAREGWRCMPTYRRIANGCVEYELPSNAEYSKSDQGWRCKVGYVQDVDQCKLDERISQRAIDDHRCKRGHRLGASGCEVSSIPEHAMESDSYGWVCVVGFAERNGRCVPEGQAADEPGPTRE